MEFGDVEFEVEDLEHMDDDQHHEVFTKGHDGTTLMMQKVFQVTTAN